jgi:Domain of unknown function (DUF4062)
MAVSFCGGIAVHIYISSVAAELGSYRAKIAESLRAQGYVVDVAGPEPRLRNLAQAIGQSDIVVALIGERCGAFPDFEQVDQFGDVAYQHNFCTDTGSREASFTQWELLLACQLDVSVIAIDFTASVPRDTPNPERGDRQTDQAAFRHWVAELAMERQTVTEADAVLPAVLSAVRLFSQRAASLMTPQLQSTRTESGHVVG